MRSLFLCPLCGQPLERKTAAYVCPSGHSYDIAKEGYTYLLPPNQKHSSAPGDDKAMAAARRDFLSKGFYQHLLEALTNLILARAGESPILLDAGCGEGYYTSGIFRALQKNERDPRMSGTDISKFALRYAAKREKAVEFAVASSYRLPLRDAAADILINCFSPLALEEFRRVLRPGGWFFYVVPAADHLWELKKILYDRPYPNEEKETPYEGFRYRAVVPAERIISLESREDIQNLFRMTPYYWKTPKSGGERLSRLEHLVVRAAFRIHVFEKL